MYYLASVDGAVNENMLDGSCSIHEALKGACTIPAGEPQTWRANLTSGRS
jgi:hypothetical protein